MTYEQTIHYLYNTLPMFSRMGSDAFKKDLINIRLLCTLLDQPQQSFKSIHVAGTNGKGSVSHMMAAVLQTAGYKTGLYTSPHLYDFRERIRVNGELVDKEFVIEFVRKIKPSIERINPSFFEITVAMAFTYFKQQEVDIAIIEVGLGGRLDSTNIITPELSIITNIGWDHMNILGNSLEEIATEKAGIIKEQVPVLIGERKHGLKTIFDRVAKEKNAPITYAGDFFTVKDFAWTDDQLAITVAQKKTAAKYYLDLQGIYQTKNICTVLQALSVLRSKGYALPVQKVKDALSQVKKLTGLQGRWETIHRQPNVVLEVAHNKEGITQMLAHLDKMEYRQLHIILGIVKDKDPGPVLEQLPKDAVYYFTQAQIPRALDATLLKEKAAAFSLKGAVHPSVNEALQAAMLTANAEDLIVVCGSIFLAAEVDREKLKDLSFRQGVPGHT